jgi:hypothetical protein
MRKTTYLVALILASIFLGCTKEISSTVQNSLLGIPLDGAAISGTISALRATQFRNNTLYKSTDLGTGTWKLDVADTVSADNTGTIIVNNLGQRLKRVYSGAANSIWFGVMGNGTDETTLLQNAINASAGGTLNLSPGTIFIKQITLVSNLSIIGNNAKLRMIQGPLDNIMINMIKLSNVDISGLEIALNGITGNIWDGTTAIELSNCQNIHIHNCYIHDNTYAAIRLIGGDNQIRINNNFIENTDAGVHANNTNTDINIVSNIFSKGTSEGITIYGYNNQNYPSNFLIDSNVILNKQSFGINIPFAKFGTITHNTINNCYGGITMHDAVSVGNDNYYTSDMIIKNNIVNTANFGIIYVGDRTTISNNQISSIQQDGVNVNNFTNTSIITTGVTITNNTMVGTGLAGGGSGGITLNNLTNSSIESNRISNCGNSSSSIRFNGNCSNLLINSNNCGNGILQSPNTVYNNSITITNNILPQTYFPIPAQVYYPLKLVVAGNQYTGDTTFNTAPDNTGVYSGINSFCVRTQYCLGAGIIKSIDQSWVGRRIILHSTNWFIIEQGNNIVLKGGKGSVAQAPANGNITLVFDGSFWREISRSF